MTAIQIAQHFRAKKTGKGKWVAYCPCHQTHRPHLSISEGKRAVLIRCWSQQCLVSDILAAAGLKMSDLFYDAPSKPTPQMARVASLREQLEIRQKRLGMMDMLAATEPQKRNYWLAAAKNTEQEIIYLWKEVRPGERLPIRLRGVCMKPVPVGSWSRRDGQ